MFWRCTELDRRNLKVLGALRYTISKTEKRQQAARTPERLLVNHNDPVPYVFRKCHVGGGSGAYGCAGSDLPILERVHTGRNPKGPRSTLLRLRYTIGSIWGSNTCRHARTPGSCCASTRLRRACANTCWRWKPVCALMRAKPERTKKPGGWRRCCMISITKVAESGALAGSGASFGR